MYSESLKADLEALLITQMKGMNPHLTNKGLSPSPGAYFKEPTIRLTQTDSSHA